MAADLMRYGVIITGGPVYEQVELARAGEEAGWDGVFTWDGIHVGDDIEVHDPWALMAAFAAVTKRVILGAIVHPLPRRKPWEVARQATTVDWLSGGRLVMPVGLGAIDDAGVSGVGEPAERRLRAERLDESLDILVGLWSGEPFGFEGKHYAFEPMAFRPTPVQQPRIPIWVVGAWPRERSMRRVIRYDALMPTVVLPNGERPETTPEHVREMRDWIGERRSLDGFEIVVEGTTGLDSTATSDRVRPWRDAGATWWIESDWSNWDIGPARRRIEAGPPRLE